MINNIVQNLKNSYHIISVINLDEPKFNPLTFGSWLTTKLLSVKKEKYENNERIIFLLNEDFYAQDLKCGFKLSSLQQCVNTIDISNFFCFVVSPNKNLEKEMQIVSKTSTDKIPMQFLIVDKTTFVQKDLIVKKNQKYDYASTDLVKMSNDELDDKQNFLLTKSKTFCMLPWIHIHTYPTGETYPCCVADRAPGPLGNTRDFTLKQLWNSDKMRELRKDMLSENWNSYCTRCYEQEESGFFSGRRSANKHHGHHIYKIDKTSDDGSYHDFEMTYWDIRFSNLCNLKCRSCGYIFSSQWHSDQVKLLKEWGPDFAKKTPVFNYAGRTETDMYEQLMPHFDFVEQIYFAGGEPLIMEEHYKILEELEKRKKFDVRLIYNTNFTQVKLKDRYVFDYWKKFKSVSVGASLDAMGSRAEYIRKGTDWTIVEENRKRMIEICPGVDFYISPTLSIMNALHLPEFHKKWVDKGLIQPKDLNVNILQDPVHYRIDIANDDYKNKIKHSYEEHLKWLAPQDPLHRATLGFTSAIKFLTANNNSHLINQFWQKTKELDTIRGESCLDFIPELKNLLD